MTGEVSQNIEEKLNYLDWYLEVAHIHDDKEFDRLNTASTYLDSIREYIDYLEDQLWQQSIIE